MSHEIAAELIQPLEQDNTSAALCVVEQLVECQASLDALAQRMIGEYKPEAQAIAAKLNSLINIIDAETTSLNITPSSLTSSRQSIVERLGLSGEVLRLRSDGWTMVKMSNHFGIPASTISRFLKYYDKLQPSKQSKLRKVSVFDTAEQLEMLMVNISQQLARLQGSNDDVAVKYTGELRQTIQLAATLSEKMANYHAYQEFMKTVVGILLTELPDKRDAILSKIKLVGKSQELLSPNTIQAI